MEGKEQSNLKVITKRTGKPQPFLLHRPASEDAEQLGGGGMMC